MQLRPTKHSDPGGRNLSPTTHDRAWRDLRNEIAALWDRAAPEYDEAWAHGLRTPQEERVWSELLARYLPASQPLEVLDVGCGTGFLALLLSAAGHKVVGLDLSPLMLARAREQAEAKGLTIDFVVGDAEDPPGDLGLFDAIVSRHLLWTLPRPDRAVAAWRALAKPDAFVLAIDGFWKPRRLHDRLAALAGRGIERLFTRARSGAGLSPSISDQLPLFGLDEPEPVHDIFLRAGLTDVTVESLSEVDRVERSVMPRTQRLQLRHRRYLVRGFNPRSGETNASDT